MAKTKSDRFKNLTGQVFGRLTVLEKGVKDNNSNLQWVVQCQCGTIKSVRGFILRNGTTISCGCAQIEAAQAGIHNRSKDRVYKVWSSMWSRCTNPNNSSYSLYKDRAPPARWKSFETFIADMGERPSEFHTLERVDNDKAYGPDNCVWATRTEQNRNKSNNRLFTYNGESKLLPDWSITTGISLGTLRSRLGQLRWTVAEALGFAPRVHGNRKGN